MLEDMKIGKKLIGGFLIVVIISVIIAATGFFYISSLAEKSAEMYDDRLIPIQEIGIINAGFLQFRGDAYKAILVPELRESSLQSGDAALKRVDENAALLDQVQMTPEERKVFDAFKTAYASYKVEAAKTIDAIKKNDIEAAVASLAADTDLAKYRTQCDQALTSLTNTNMKVAEGIKKNNDENASLAETTMIIVSILGAIIGLAFAVLLTRSITRPLDKTVEMIDEINKGHLGQRLGLTRKDEIGHLAVAMDRLADMFQNHLIILLNKIAAGEKIPPMEIVDDKDEIGPALKITGETLSNLIAESTKLADAAARGDLKIRGDAESFKGGYREIIAGMNGTLDNILGPLNEAMKMADVYASGDYSYRFSQDVAVKGDFVPFRDSMNKIGFETGRAIREVQKEVDSLLAGMEETSASVEEVTAGAQNLAQNAQSVSDLSEKSGDGITQVLQAMNDLSTTVAAVATQANEVANLSQETDDLSKQGSMLVNRTDSGMQKISASFSETDRVVGEIGNQMENIGSIVNVISSIADQTNLLALNAAIEAARAGDAGLGFAVVADEVKTLALESQHSAEKIGGLISDLQRKSQAVTESMTQSLKEVEEGGAAVKETMAVFEKIASAIATVTMRVGEVAGASEEQAASVEEITASVHEVGGYMEQATRAAVDSSAATEEASAALDQITRVITDSTASVDRISQSMGKFTT
jgi:methyl-accepting chemotaxis protein